MKKVMKALFVPKFQSKTSKIMYIPAMFCGYGVIIVAGIPMMCTAMIGAYLAEEICFMLGVAE